MSKKPGPAVILKPLEVEVTGSLESALHKFKKMVQDEKIIGQVKANMEYKKPSVKKRLKRREAEERRLLQEMREKMIKSGEWERRKKKKEQKRAQKQEQKIRKQKEADI